MIPNVFQSVEEIIKISSPAQKILWQQIRLITGENAAVKQLIFHGDIAGTEFLTYSATKLYFAYQLACYDVSGAATQSMLLTYDRANALTGYISGSVPYWNATGATVNFTGHTFQAENIIFSRLDRNQLSYFGFIGFRIDG